MSLRFVFTIAISKRKDMALLFGNFMLCVVIFISVLGYYAKRGKELEAQEKIKDVVDECVSSIVTLFENAISRGSFSQAVQDTKTLTNHLGVKILEVLCEKVDKLFREERDKHRITIKDKSKTRHLITELGEVTLRRICYFDKQQNRRFFAVDEMLGLEKRYRVEQGLQAKLIEGAALKSYGRSSADLGNVVSRQTVYNLAKKLRKIEAEEPIERRNVNNIYIEADEDHIHLQTGKSAEVKLVYVHDGVKTICKDRTQLENVRYFVSVDDDPDKIWNDVAQYVYRNYSMSNAKIHISGDGASWIKYAQRIIPNSEYHIDKFHIQKAATIIAKGNKHLRRLILQAMRTRNKDVLKNLCCTQYLHFNGRSERQTIAENYFYLRNNLSSYSAQNKCSAEGHVSHVLSARMSSRPMGWSVAGAGQIAKLRAFYFNGGDFLELIRCGKNEIEDMQKLYTQKFKSSYNAVKNSAESSIEPYKVAGLDGLTTKISYSLRHILKN